MQSRSKLIERATHKGSAQGKLEEGPGRKGDTSFDRRGGGKKKGTGGRQPELYE